MVNDPKAGSEISKYLLEKSEKDLTYATVVTNFLELVGKYHLPNLKTQKKYFRELTNVRKIYNFDIKR